MKWILIILLFLTNLSMANVHNQVRRYHRRYSQSYFTNGGFTIEMNTQNTSVDIVDDPYLEGEQIQDKQKPNLIFDIGLSFNLRKVKKKVLYKPWL